MNRSFLTSLTIWQIDACGLLLIVALAAGAWFLGIAPLHQRRQQAAARQHQLQDQTQQVKQFAGQVRQLTRRLADTRQALSEIHLNLQPASRVNQRLAEVTATAGQCGLEVSDVRPGRPIATSRHTIVPIELSGSGSYPAAARFVHAFLQTFADSGVASFELAGDPTRPGTPASYYFRLHWYVEPQPALAAP